MCNFDLCSHRFLKSKRHFNLYSLFLWLKYWFQRSYVEIESIPINKHHWALSLAKNPKLATRDTWVKTQILQTQLLTLGEYGYLLDIPRSWLWNSQATNTKTSQTLSGEYEIVDYSWILIKLDETKITLYRFLNHYS